MLGAFDAREGTAPAVAKSRCYTNCAVFGSFPSNYVSFHGWAAHTAFESSLLPPFACRNGFSGPFLESLESRDLLSGTSLVGVQSTQAQLFVEGLFESLCNGPPILAASPTGLECCSKAPRRTRWCWHSKTRRRFRGTSLMSFIRTISIVRRAPPIARTG